MSKNLALRTWIGIGVVAIVIAGICTSAEFVIDPPEKQAQAFAIARATVGLFWGLTAGVAIFVIVSVPIVALGLMIYKVVGTDFFEGS
jgi:uncharacterized membrane protein